MLLQTPKVAQKLSSTIALSGQAYQQNTPTQPAYTTGYGVHDIMNQSTLGRESHWYACMNTTSSVMRVILAVVFALMSQQTDSPYTTPQISIYIS